MALYLGSNQVGYNSFDDCVRWIGFSESIATKMTSSSTSAIVSAIIEAPAGCSIYAYNTSTSFLTAQYSTTASLRYSRYYLMGEAVRASLAKINTQNLIYPQSYLTSVVATLSRSSNSYMYYLGANAIAYGITDTIIRDSTLIYSRSSVIESFFPGIINSFIKVDASKLVSIPSEAFKNRRTLISINIPNCTTIGDSAFYYCQSLISANFPECTTIGSYGFYNCISLVSVNFPKCTTVYKSAFTNCNLLTTISFPSCTIIDDYAFAYCDLLTSVNFPKCTTIEESAFMSCFNLISFNLTGVSSVPTLSGSRVFVSTPIGGYSTSAGQYGSVYVPASLYNDFITAENWSDISSRIVSV